MLHYVPGCDNVYPIAIQIARDTNNSSENMASTDFRREILCYLLDNGADLEWEETSALEELVYGNDVEFIQLVLEKYDFKPHSIQSAYDLAVERENKEIAILLKEYMQ